MIIEPDDHVSRYFIELGNFMKKYISSRELTISSNWLLDRGINNATKKAFKATATCREKWTQLGDEYKALEGCEMSSVISTPNFDIVHDDIAVIVNFVSGTRFKELDIDNANLITFMEMTKKYGVERFIIVERDATLNKDIK